MAAGTRAREVEITLPKVVERRGDYKKSGDVARQHTELELRLKG